MSRQSFINDYYKFQATPNMKDKRKRNLSLIKHHTPIKIPKMEEDVINLCSDEEDKFDMKPAPENCQPSSQGSNDSQISSDSVKTEIYSLSPAALQNSLGSLQNANESDTIMDEFECPLEPPGNLQNDPTLSQKSQNTPLKAPETPRKTAETNQTTPGSSKTSQSRQTPSKFYSPVKKRTVPLVRSPISAKRNLSQQMLTVEIPCSPEDIVFKEACEGMDDKTKFLLTTIKNYLHDDSIRHLLDRESQLLLTRCLLVVKPGLRLVCRLYWRKEGWFKKIKMSEICEEKKAVDDQTMEAMMDSLVEGGFIVQGDRNMTFEDYTAILSKDELKETCKNLKLKVNSKKEAIEELTKFKRCNINLSNYLNGQTSTNASRLLKMLSAQAGPCYKLSDAARNTLYNIYVLSYLGMNYEIIREKRLELVLLYDLAKRETYPIDKEMKLDNASVVFESNEEFQRYVTAQRIFEDFLEMTEPINKIELVKQVYDMYKGISPEHMKRYKSHPPWLRRFTPASIYVKILEGGIQDLKKKTDSPFNDNIHLAVDILNDLIEQTEFRQNKKAEWYAEKALILHSILRRHDEAAETLIEGFKSTMSEELKDSMRPRARKISSQQNTALAEHLKMQLSEYATKESILENNLPSRHIYKQPMERTSSRGKVVFESRTQEGRKMLQAEEFCIADYIHSREYTHGEHWEGRIVTTVFFLLFWDIIYGPLDVRGIFMSHYQQHPLDLFTESFYQNRKARIDRWLQVVAEATENKLVAMMFDTWNSRPQTELSYISRNLEWENIEAVARCLGPQAVSAICRRLATNYRYAHSGFPDLTLWNVHTKKIKFVEVKTDSDKPSMKQIQWMHYLRANDIEVEFCYVGANTTRQRSRASNDARPDKQTTKKKKHIKVKDEI